MSRVLLSFWFFNGGVDPKLYIHVIVNLVVAPWDDPIQDDRGKAAKVMTYDIQDFRKNSDVTPFKDTGTLDQWEHKPGGHPYDQETLNKENEWVAEGNLVNLLVGWLIKVWNENQEILSIQVKSTNFSLGFMLKNWDLGKNSEIK